LFVQRYFRFFLICLSVQRGELIHLGQSVFNNSPNAPQTAEDD
jgi:hypothetical protein